MGEIAEESGRDIADVAAAAARLANGSRSLEMKPEPVVREAALRPPPEGRPTARGQRPEQAAGATRRAASKAPIMGREGQQFGELGEAAVRRTKDSCRFVCENDADGLELKTLDGRTFLAVNGVQTLSHEYLNLIHELPALRAMGVSRFRLSPHSMDMVQVASIFADVVGGGLAPQEAAAKIDAIKPDAPFCNGFYYGRPGHSWVPRQRRGLTSECNDRAGGRRPRLSLIFEGE